MGWMLAEALEGGAIEREASAKNICAARRRADILHVMTAP